MAGGADSGEALLHARARVPGHVVHRDFRSETVVLNLRSGAYHGLDPTATRMLAALEAEPNVGAAIERLARDLEHPRDAIQRDVLSFCRALEDRGLIEFDGRSD